MLATRVITAVVAMAILLVMVFLASPAVWAAFMLAVALVSSWEWSRIAALAPAASYAFLALSAATGVALWFFYVQGTPAAFGQLALAGFGIAAAFWIVAAPFWLAQHLTPGPAARAVAGWIVVWPTWLACVVLREAGPWLLLAVAAIVWVADIAAYFAGRRFGRRKLAPRISPGKTWEGVYGALAGVAVYGVVLALIAKGQAAPFTGVFRAGAGVPAIVAMLALALLSIVGDLFESWMKRGAGMKDSSALLPGHGGMLDRIDALTATLPVAALALGLVGWR